MEKKEPSNFASAEFANSQSIDLTSIFDNNKTKKILQANPNVGRIRGQSLTLINTASALFLQGLVQKAASHAVTQYNTTDSNDDDKGKPIVINMEAIQSVMDTKSEQYGFLQQAISLEERKGHISVGEHLFKPMKKCVSKNNKRSISSNYLKEQQQQCKKTKVLNDQKTTSSVTAAVMDSEELKSIKGTMDVAAVAAAASSGATGNISFHTLQQEIVEDESDYD